MSFLKELKEDLTQAVNELVTEENAKAAETAEPAETEPQISDDEMINTLDEDVMADLDLDLDLDTINGLMEDDETEEAEEKTEESAPTLTEEEPAPVLVEEEPEPEPPVQEKTTTEIQKQEKKDKEDNMDNAVNENTVEINEDDMPSDEVAEITKGTSITGNITSDGSINVYGKIIGDVTCKGKLIISGAIKGTSKAGEIFANNSKIEGDVNSVGSVKIGNGSVIIGNVYATSAVIGGAVRGDIDVHGPVIVDATAVVQGNIKSRSVQINNGAAIEGYCSQCYADVDYQALFDDTFGK